MANPSPPALKTSSPAPTQKVAAGGLGGAVSVIVIGLLQHFAHWSIDPTYASAITIVVSFIVSYFVPPSARDIPVQA